MTEAADYACFKLSGKESEENIQIGTPLVAQTVKNPPAAQETQLQFLGQEDTMEKGMDTHSSVLAWRVGS